MGNNRKHYRISFVGDTNRKSKYFDNIEDAIKAWNEILDCYSDCGLTHDLLEFEHKRCSWSTTNGWAGAWLYREESGN